MSQRTAITLLSCALLAGASAADEGSTPDCGDAAATAVQQRYDGVQDISASFEQRTQSALTGEQAVSRGHVVLAKPGRMRWSYEEPEPSLVVSDGETLWLYDPAFGEAQKYPATEGFLTGATAQFLLGGGDMRRDFVVVAVSCQEGQAELELTPRAPAPYEKLFLQVDPKAGTVRSTRVVDLVGNISSVAFSELRLDTQPPPETFRFEAPEGVDVIEVTP